MGMKWEDITPDLTKKGQRELKVGQVLIFDYEGSPIHLKIMRKSHGKVWAKRLDPKKFLTPQQADDSVTVTQN